MSIDNIITHMTVFLDIKKNKTRICLNVLLINFFRRKLSKILYMDKRNINKINNHLTQKGNIN
jgi:hypothetical protein